jgi:hypothetical protein
MPKHQSNPPLYKTNHERAADFRDGNVRELNVDQACDVAGIPFTRRQGLKWLRGKGAARQAAAAYARNEL